ncbi:Peptidyl-prolyl cis-trans isomerase D [Buchnera aphidicola (Cinara laricifoliae)]|uniref:Peptidyl-prolyl cis-trans isomerase D n=2 Tax=Buchnera aphidicola TaxID=9 RepID=A0A451DBQ4_9GAMM|nr:Peptidyl-prolyl cis-trans isomerase D [Buchnera aphidicola (Cinara laricifoliae)]
MSLLQNFYKKNVLIVIITAIIFSIILSSISNFFIHNTQSSILKINEEKIYPKILQLNYYITQKNNNKNIKNIFSTTINKKEYTQYIFKQIITKMINESLLKQYADKINLHMLDKHAIKMIISSKYFQVNNSFNYKKYIKFINFIMYSHNKYVNSLKKKIAVKYLIKILLKSIIILKHDIREKFKKIIDRNNIQIIDFKINVKKLIKKSDISKIQKSLYINKDIFQNHRFYTIKIIRLKKKNIIKNNIKNNLILDKNQNKKKIIEKKYNYRYIRTNNFKTALKIMNQIKIKNFNKNISNIILKKNQKKFNYINLGWIKKNNIPNFIKNFKLKKNGDHSKIIFYKNNFFIFQLYQTKNFNKITKKIIKNYIKKIEKFNHIFFENIIKKNNLNFLLKNHHIKLEQLFSNNIKNIYVTKPMLYEQLIKYFYSNKLKKYIKKNFSYTEIHKKNSSIKLYKSKNNYIYLLQINSKKIKNLQKEEINYEKILKNLILEKIKKKNCSLIKKFLSTNYNEKKYFLKKHPIYIHQPQTLSYEKNKEIIKIIKKIPIQKKNNSIYFLLPNSEKKYILIILQNNFFKKINKIEKIDIIKQIKQYMKIKVITTMLQNLYKKSKIIYNSDKI